LRAEVRHAKNVTEFLDSRRNADALEELAGANVGVSAVAASTFQRAAQSYRDGIE
jgi:hypothetical protein